MKNKEKKYSPLTAYSIWTNVQRKIQKRCLKKNVKNSSEDLMPITEVSNFINILEMFVDDCTNYHKYCEICCASIIDPLDNIRNYHCQRKC
jgi:hypothetical protein